MSPGPVSSAATGPSTPHLIALGLRDAPIDWLLYSDFAVFVGLVSSYMPFMIFPLVLSIARSTGNISRRAHFWERALSHLPAHHAAALAARHFAAIIFGFVGCFGESAVPIIMGGVGYELVGNTITSSMDVLNYPLAAALSSIVVAHHADADDGLVSHLRHARFPRKDSRMERR